MMTLCCDSVIFIFFVHFSYFVFVFYFFVCLKFGVRKFNTNIFMFYLSFLVTSWRLFTLLLGKVQKQLPKVFFKKAVLNNLQENNFAGISVLIKFQPWLATLLKKRLQLRCFPLTLAKLLRCFHCSRWTNIAINFSTANTKLGHSGVFFVNSDGISHIFLVFPSLIWNK